MSVTIPPPHSGVIGKGVHQPYNWIQDDDPVTTNPSDVVNGQWWFQRSTATLFERDAGVWEIRMESGAGAVTSVNGLNGVVSLTADDIPDTATNVFATPAELTKLAAIEPLADVTDAANVAAAGAVMEADTSTAAMGFVIDEDTMVSNSATKIPTQQSVKAYVDAAIPGAGLSFAQVTYTTMHYFGNGTDAITAGVQDGGIYHDHAVKLVGWSAAAKAAPSGSAFVVDLWTDAFPANYPPTVADTIMGAEKPTVAIAAVTGEDLSLNGGAGISIAASRYTRFNVDSAGGVTFAEVMLHWLRV